MRPVSTVRGREASPGKLVQAGSCPCVALTLSFTPQVSAETWEFITS